MMRSTGMHKPPIPPKPTLVQQHQRSEFSPGTPRREGLLLPSPGTPRRTKPQLAPKPRLSKLSGSPESKAFAPRSQIPQRTDVSNSQRDVQQENSKKPNWDYIIPICLCSKENCTCIKNTNKLEKDVKIGSGWVAVANGGERMMTNGYLASHAGLQQPPTAERNLNSSKSPVRPRVPHRTWSDEANGNLTIQAEPGERTDEEEEEEEEEKQKTGKKPAPVPLPRKPRMAALSRQEKVEEDREEIRSQESRGPHVTEVKVPLEGKSNSSPAGGRDPPPRKRPFLLTPERTATSAALRSLPKDEEEEEEEEEELGWDSSSHEMDVSLDKEDETVEEEEEEEEAKGAELHAEAVYADFTSLVETAELRRHSPEDLKVKVTPKKPQRKRSPMAAWRQRSEEKPSDRTPSRATKEPPRLPAEKPSRILAAATAIKPQRPSLGKQRAKSFSSADLVCSEGQRKSSFRKLLDLKLTVKILPKLVVKGSPDGGSGSEQSVDGPLLRPSEQLNRGRDLPQPLIGVEQSVDGDERPPGDDADIYYENVPYYEEIADYINVDVGSAGSTSLLRTGPAWPGSAWPGLMYDDEGIYEEQEPYMSFQKPAEQQQQQQQPAERDRDSVDEEVVYPDNSLSDDTVLASSSDEEEEEEEEDDDDDDDEDDDSSSLSSKGDGERPEESLKQSGQQQQKKKSKIQHIATEIMSSESVFVDVLKLLHVDFRGTVSGASRQNGKPVIEERLLNQILYYLPQLYELNQDLLRELKQRVAKWDENSKLADIFLKKGPYLKMYSTYIREFDKNVALLEEQSKKNPAFCAVVREFEASPLCAKLALKHYLLKPVQRIPQYQLLLTDYLKNLSEDSSDYKDTQDALAIVKEVANHANDIMKQGDNFQKLIQVQCRLIGNHEIVQPGRVFLKEGVLKKLSRKVMQPRMFFLFSDSLLYTTPAQSGQFKVKNMFSLAGMKVSKPSQEAYQNELNIESVERSFTLSASSASERDEWLEAITTAIGDYTRKKITFISGKAQDEKELWGDEDGAPLGSKAPIWIPDLRATMCMICTCEFTLAWRRHHCRACGKVVCKSCSSNKCRLEYRKNELLRVCDQCFLTLQQQKSEMAPSLTASPGSRATFAFHRKQKKKIPAALKEVSANTDSSMSGYLYKSKCDKKQGKRQWFVIKDKVLYTYAASEDVAALKSQPLLGFELKAESPQSLQFKLYHKKTLYFVFRADDVQTAQRWIDSFREATVL